MKLVKKIVPVMLSLSLCASLVAPALAASFTDLQDVIDNNGKYTGNEIIRENDKITLNGNVTRGDDEANKSITISEGKNVTIDLNGNNIDGDGKGGTVIKVTGQDTSLTLTDTSDEGTGTVTGGTATTYYGGGVNVSDHASFTMDGGTISGNEAKHGAGVYIENGSTFTMNDGEISDNTASSSGGGVFVHNYGDEDHSTFVMEGGKITGNTAYEGETGGLGGGVAAYGTKHDATDVIINGGEITGNAAGGTGGGISVTNGAVSINGGTVSNNNADQGGGVYIYDSNASIKDAEIKDNDAITGGGIFTSSGSNVNVTDSTITNNTATNGGGIANQSNTGVTGATITIDNSTISGNTANGYGGGVYANNGTVNMTDSTITGNEASHGGGISVWRGSDVTVKDSTISDNSATCGGGIYAQNSNTTVNVTNSTITGNSAVSGGGVYNYTSSTFSMEGGLLYGNSATGNSADLRNTNGTVKLVDVNGQDLKLADGTAITGWLWDSSTRWDAESDGNHKYDFNRFTNYTGNLYLIAAHDKYYEVVYRDGANVLQSGTWEKGEQVPAYEGTLNRDGYVFAGWAIDGTSTEVDPETMTITGTLTLVALWTYVGVPGGGTTGGDEIEIDDQAVPLAAGPVTRAEFVDYLWRHEGEPDSDGVCTFADVAEDHEFILALAWAEQAGIITAYEDGTFDPDELVTVGAVQEFLANFARIFELDVDVYALASLTGDEDEAVLNCDEVLAEFFDEELAQAA